MIGRNTGTITVFLSLVGVLFLSLICSLVESARLQGARAKAAMLTDVGLFSVFGEYEEEMLEEFDVLFLDGSYGSGKFQIENVSKRLKQYVKPVASGNTFELLPISVRNCKVPAFALATDDQGSVFYQKAVESQKELMALDLLQKFQETCTEAKKQEEAGKNCEAGSKEMNEEIERLQDEAEQEKERDGQEELEHEKQEVQNPIEVINQIKKMGILGLVLKNPGEVSDKSVKPGELPSGRALNKGNLKLEERQKGIMAEGIFLEYIKNHFECFTGSRKGALSYELEYILVGKDNDADNLKGAVNRLLLMREGSNFLYVMGNETMKQQALLLAAAIAGPAAIPGLVTVVKLALLLAWAYGESLLDVRILLSGGKVPIVKTAKSWKLSLENLGQITELLDNCDSEEGEGTKYEEYLQMLLALGKKADYPMRVLDLIEGRVRAAEGYENFRADSCVAQIEAEADWELKTVFLRVVQSFLGSGGFENKLRINGCFGY